MSSLDVTQSSAMSNTTCTWTDSSKSIAKEFETIIYHYLTPTYIIIGCSGNLILLNAFHKQSKTEKAYWYQVIFTISKTIEILIFGTFLIAGGWLEPAHVSWFVQSYILVFIFCYIFFVLHLTMIITSLLLAVAMAADRVIAVLRPVKYQTLNHKCHQIFSALCCFLISFFGSGIYFGATRIIQIDNRYTILVDAEIEYGVIGSLCGYTRLVTRVGGLILLIILNLTMVLLYRRQKNKVAALSNQAQEKWRSKEKTLLWINIYQACMMLLNQMPHVTWVHLIPQVWVGCYGIVIGSACDAMVMITDALDFFIVIAINKRVRKLIMDVVMPRK